jgi:hypothetical protein
MRCPDEVEKEINALLAKEVDETEDQMKRELNRGRDGQYGEVKIGPELENI